MKLSESLALALKCCGMTQSELARRVGIGRSSVAEYLAGTHIPRRAVLDKINRILGTDLRITGRLTARQVAKDMHRGQEAIMEGLK